MALRRVPVPRTVEEFAHRHAEHALAPMVPDWRAVEAQRRAVAAAQAQRRAVGAAEA